MGNIKRNMGRIALLLALCLATVSVLTVAQAKHPSVAHADWSSDMDDCSQLTPSIAYNYDGNQLYNWGGPLGDWSWDGGQHYLAACDNSSPAWGNDGTDPTTHVAYADTTHNINN